MSRTAACAADLFEFESDQPERWLARVSQGPASWPYQSDKVAHLMLFHLDDTGNSQVTPCPAQRLAAMVTVSAHRVKLGPALIHEALVQNHPDQDAVIATLLPGLSGLPAVWGQVVGSLLKARRTEQLAAWLSRLEWPRASVEQLQAVVIPLAQYDQASLLAAHRPHWQPHPALVAALLNLAVPGHPLLLPVVLAAAPPEAALEAAWYALGNPGLPEDATWQAMAQALPSAPLAAVVLQRQRLWLSEEGAPIEDPCPIYDRLGGYADPATQAQLLARHPGCLPRLLAQVRAHTLHRRSSDAPSRPRHRS